MAEPNPTPNPADDPAANKGDKDKKTETLTQEQVNSLIAERLAEANAKHEKVMAEKIKQAQTEAERLAKLSADEKADEERKKRDETTSARETELTLREMKLEAKELLEKKGISATLVDLVVVADADKTKSNVDALEKAFNKAVEDKVTEKLKGKSPEDIKPTGNKGASTNAKTGTTAF